MSPGLDSFDITRIVDGVIKGLGEHMYELPQEFKESVLTNHMLPAINIPCKNNSMFYLLELYITNTGGMIWRVRDPFGAQIYERAFA